MEGKANSFVQCHLFCFIEKDKFSFSVSIKFLRSFYKLRCLIMFFSDAQIMKCCFKLDSLFLIFVLFMCSSSGESQLFLMLLSSFLGQLCNELYIYNGL